MNLDDGACPAGSPAEASHERPERAFEEAFGGRRVKLVCASGAEEVLDVQHWRADADATDRRLFVDPCDGPTLDVGCGPGRLVKALLDQGVDAIGVDASVSAVRLARARGALALRRDLFERLPGEGGWRHVLLADGNIGIGGRPVRLLRRARQLMADDGLVHVEVAPEGVGLVQEHRRLRVDGILGAPFEWAVVGLDAVERLAHRAGLEHVDTRHEQDRWVAVLRRRA